jgi:transcriptional regulator GlxA family with amidase domain
VLRNVAVAVGDGIAVFELGVACEVFGLDRTADGLPGFDFAVCALASTPITTSAGFRIDAPFGLDRLEAADLVVVPGWTPVDRPLPAPFAAALRRAAARGARIMSFCSGAFALAAAGLLDGRRAATHWRYAAQLAQLHPAVEVDASVLYVDSDPIFTSAGTAAGIDLCLHLLRKEFGSEVANAIARRMVVAPHRAGGQAQYVERSLQGDRAETRLADVLEWARQHLGESLSVNQLARRAHMSPRTFARHFQGAAGTTPHRWLVEQRVVAAQELLERSRMSVEEVAARCGFNSTAALRFQFARRVGTPPIRYREQFSQRRAS